MKTRLLVITPGTHNTPLNTDNLLHYLLPFDNTPETAEPDTTEYSWMVDTALIHAGDSVHQFTIDALDIEFDQPLPYLKGDLHVLLVYPMHQLPVYDAQVQIIDIALMHRVSFTDGVMQLPSEWEDFDLQGYSFTVPELADPEYTLQDWLTDAAPGELIDCGHGPL